jgi:hypothetical protein
MVMAICKLRGHHLVCLHFFSGEGYDDDFTENLTGVIAAAEEGSVEVHEGSDAICLKCPSLRGNRCMHSADSEDDIRLLDGRALRLLDLLPGQRVKWQYIKTILPSIFHEWHQSSCPDCNWKQACERNALYRELKNKGRR